MSDLHGCEDYGATEYPRLQRKPAGAGALNLGLYCGHCAKWIKWLAQTPPALRDAPPKLPAEGRRIARDMAAEVRRRYDSRRQGEFEF